MKKIISFIVLFTFGFSFSQNVFPTAAGTNVGIGTGATAPTTRLQLTSATAGTSGFRLTNLTSSTATTAGLLNKALSVDANGNVVLVPVANTSLFTADGALASTRTVNMSGFNLTFNPSTANSSIFYINGVSGNVGIGTSAPTARLQITGPTPGTSGIKLTNFTSTTEVTTGLLGKALSVDASGNVVLVPVANTDTSIYSGNGSLTSVRTLTLSGNNLTFTPSTASSSTGSYFFINGTSGNIGIGNTAPSTRLEVTSGTAGDSGFKLTNLLSTSTAAAANGRALSVDNTGKVILVPAGAPTLYTENGTLTGTGDRIVSLSGKKISFNPSNNASFSIDGGNGFVGVGTNTPSSALEVKGIAKAEEGEFFKSQPDGATFVDWKDRAIKTRVLNLGTVRDPLENGRLLCFYDFPQSNVINTSKSAFALTIDDRNNKTRFKTNADTGGMGNMSLLDKNQTEYLKVDDDGNDNFSMTMPKPNSRFGIGTATPSTKLEVVSGTAGDSGVKLTNLATPITPAASNGKALSVDDTGKVILVNAAGNSSNIYTSDGTLADNRAVNLAGKNLSFNNSSGLGTSFNINGSNGKVSIGKYSDITAYGYDLNPYDLLLSRSFLSAGGGLFLSDLRIENSANLFVDGDIQTAGLNASEVKTSSVQLTNLATPAPANGKALSVDDTGKVILVAAGGTGTSSNIYTSDGTLTNATAGLRTVNLEGNKLSFKSSNGSRFNIDGTNGNVNVNGNVEISNNINVSGNIDTASNINLNNGGVLNVVGGTINLDESSIRFRKFSNGSWDMYSDNDNSLSFISTSTNPQLSVASLIMSKEGNIGMGTNKFIDPADNKEYKLSINGFVRATKVKVYNTWADYVFNKEYNLLTLNELEKYIKENGHLPNVPSAKEVEQKGLDLGDMSRIQQEKIEELTLYLIQQNKEIQELKEQVKILMSKK
jgi:hypothetical protein